MTYGAFIYLVVYLLNAEILHKCKNTLTLIINHLTWLIYLGKCLKY